MMVVGLVGACAPATKNAPDGTEPSFESDGVSAVSVGELEIYGAGGLPSIPIKLWYRTTDSELNTFGESRIRPGYKAVKNGEPLLSRSSPLIILLHGSGGDPDGMAWLALDLARRGALVVAASHPDSSGGDPERLSILHVWSQPADVTRMLDFLIKSEWNTRFDPQKIVAIGFSAGGASALLLAGARLDFARFPEFCETQNDGACNAFRGHFPAIDEDFLLQANADHSDARLAAAVAIAPAFTESMTKESITDLSTPVLILSGELDQQLPPATHLRDVPERLPQDSEYREIKDAQHFSFLPVCRDDAASILAETNETFVCEEFGEKSRNEIHQEALGLISQFLTDTDVFQAGR